jgi:hypothetical protein
MRVTDIRLIFVLLLFLISLVASQPSWINSFSPIDFPNKTVNISLSSVVPENSEIKLFFIDSNNKTISQTFSSTWRSSTYYVPYSKENNYLLKPLSKPSFLCLKIRQNNKITHNECISLVPNLPSSQSVSPPPSSKTSINKATPNYSSLDYKLVNLIPFILSLIILTALFLVIIRRL